MDIKMYINGQWKDSQNNKVIDVYNPSNGKVYATIPRGTTEDVNNAVNAAKNAFNNSEWKSTSPKEKGKILYKISEKLTNQRDLIAELESTDVGKPLKQGYSDVDSAIRYFEFYAGAVDKVMGETIPIQNGLLDFTIREPLGVTAHIAPWNYPLQILSRSVAAAIAMGNTIVLKSAEDTPATANKIAEFFDELELPDGVFNHVTGLGFEAGEFLSTHEDINHLTFTGSVPTGIRVAKNASENIVPVTLELGGKSPNIVFKDCDIKSAVEGVVKAIIQNGGQTCSAGSRLLIEESFKEEFIEKVIQKFKSLSIGEALDDYDIGPILNEKQYERVMEYINMGREEGEVLVGGKTVEVNDGGFYIEPTIIDKISPESRIAQEEIFGPVLTVFTFKNEEEAISLANSTKFGLVTGIWTESITRAHDLADQISSGQVFINNYGAAGGVEMPFGGYKHSGYGREKGFAALYNYTQLKNVAIKYR